MRKTAVTLRKLALSAVSLCLVLALCACAAQPVGVSILAAAEYPDMPDYPGIDGSGMAMEKWRKGVSAQRRDSAYADGLQPCMQALTAQLLAENGGEIEEKRGVSCLIVNGEKGRVLLDRYGDGIRRFPSSYDKAARYNRQLTASSEQKAERETVLALARQDYGTVETWYRRRLRPVKVKRALR